MWEEMKKNAISISATPCFVFAINNANCTPTPITTLKTMIYGLTKMSIPFWLHNTHLRFSKKNIGRQRPH